MHSTRTRRRWRQRFRRSATRSSRLAPSGLAGDPPDPAAVPDRLSLPSAVPARDGGVRARRRRVAATLPGLGSRVHQAVTSPLLRLSDAKVTYAVAPSRRPAGEGGRWCRPHRRTQVRCWRWSARVAAARPRWLARCSALQPLSGGSIEFDGEPLPTTRSGLRAYRRKAQLVFQDPTGSVNPRQSIYEIVAEGLRIHRERTDEAARVATALSDSGLRPPEQFFLRFPHELSGGQRQRVVIAGAMVLQPSLLVADEPVSSLDASVRGEILQLLLGLSRDRGMTILVVTHDLGLAWNIADRVAVMYLGRIVEVGTTEQILSDPQHPYTKALLSVVPEQDRARAADPHRRGTRLGAHPRRVPLPSPLPPLPER